MSTSCWARGIRRRAASAWPATRRTHAGRGSAGNAAHRWRLWPAVSSLETMRRRLDSLLAAPGLTRSRFIALALVSLIATSVVIAEGLRRDGSPYGLLAAAYSRPAPQVEVTASPAPAPATAVAAAPAGDAPAAGSDEPAAVADSAVAAAPVQTLPATTPVSTPAPAPTPTTPVAAKPASKITHVFVVDIAGSDHEATWGDTSTATYLNGTLKPQGVLLGGYKALPEGDLATLMALTSGQTPTPQTTSGCPQYGNDCTFPVETLSLPDQVTAKGLRWRAYLEDAGQPCRHPAAGASDDPGEYSTKHNPFVFYRSLTELGDCTSNDLPLESLAADLKTAADTPNFSFIAPNLCHGGWENPCADGSGGG